MLSYPGKTQYHYLIESFAYHAFVALLDWAEYKAIEIDDLDLLLAELVDPLLADPDLIAKELIALLIVDLNIAKKIIIILS